MIMINKNNKMGTRSEKRRGGTCMIRVSYEDDSVQGFKHRKSFRDLGDKRCGRPDVK